MTTNPAYAKADYSTKNSANHNYLTITEKWLDSQVNQAFRQHHAPAYSIGLILDGRLALNKSYGVMNIRTGAATSLNAGYQIASITKTFVAALAAKLATENLIELDAPITKYAPNLVFHPDINTDNMTLRNLLSHHSGLPRSPNNRKNIRVAELDKLFDPTIGAAYNTKNLIQAVATTAPKYPAGKHYHYSNYGMFLAAYILTKASGERTFYQALSNHILAPLKLKNTFVRTSSKRDKTMATPYASQENSSLIAFPNQSKRHVELPAWRFGEVTGALGLTSNVNDLSQYITHLLNPSDSSKPLNTKAIETLFRPNAEFIKDDTYLHTIGLGWQIREFGQYGTVYSHGGHNDGHHAYIIFSRSKKMGVIMLSNGPHNINKTLASQTMLRLLQTFGKKQSASPST